ncbi:MAG: serine--tRNA ligase [Planctomycetota bacterium]|nr:serine--tRNA ligase [Planctomycetota bacterium]
MLDLGWIREHPDEVRRGAARKGIAFDVDALLALDEERRQLIHIQEQAKAEQNALGKQVATLAGDSKQVALTRLKQLKEGVKEHTDRLAPIQQQIDVMLLACPNPPADDVPDGPDDSANVELRTEGTKATFDFQPKDHVELMRQHDWLDVDRAGRLAGSRSYVLKGEAVLLEQAVLRLAMDLIVERGYTMLSVPVIVKEWALRGTAYFPGAEEQTYRIANPTSEDEAFWLVGTSEVSVTALHGGEILDHADLPLKYAGISPCFRREAGTYGKDTRGVYRVHQFNKVEQVVVDVADDATSRQHHADILENAEEMLRRLGLAYRVMAVAAGDMGRGARFKYDLEAWMPGRDAYGETHSATRFRDYQARRLDLRYRDAEGKVRHCHTLNNTVIASPRVLVAFVETHQQADGTIAVPAALQPYLNGRTVLGKA